MPIYAKVNGGFKRSIGRKTTNAVGLSQYRNAVATVFEVKQKQLLSYVSRCYLY